MTMEVPDHQAQLLSKHEKVAGEDNSNSKLKNYQVNTVSTFYMLKRKKIHYLERQC